MVHKDPEGYISGSDSGSSVDDRNNDFGDWRSDDSNPPVPTTALFADASLEPGMSVLTKPFAVEALAARLTGAGHAMAPLDDAPSDGMMDRFVDLPTFGEAASPLGTLHPPHLRLSVRGYPVTSAGILVRAGGARSP